MAGLFNDIVKSSASAIGEKIGEKVGFFQKISQAEPVPERLPQRNQPYTREEEFHEDEDDKDFEQFQQFNRSPRANYPTISDEDLNLLADQETEFLLVKLDTFVGVGKGIIAELLVSKDDIRILNEALVGIGNHSPVDIQLIQDKFDLKKKFEQDKAQNKEDIKNLLRKIVVAEMIRKRANGTLQLPSASDFIKRLVISQLTEISGRNFQVFTSIGSNIVKKAKDLF